MLHHRLALLPLLAILASMGGLTPAEEQPQEVFGFRRILASIQQNGQEYEVVIEGEGVLPDYAVIDALVGINSGVRAYPFRPGPGGPMRAILAGPDPVAVDAVACLAMTYDPATIGHLVLAEAVGLGVADPARIAVRGAGIQPFRQEYATPVNGMYVPGRWSGRT